MPAHGNVVNVKDGVGPTYYVIGDVIEKVSYAGNASASICEPDEDGDDVEYHHILKDCSEYERQS